MPAESASLWALYDKLWPLAFAAFYWLFKRGEKNRESTDAGMTEIRKTLAEHEAEMRLRGQRLDSLESRAKEDREMFRHEFEQIHKEMALIRKDFGQGFKDMGDRIMKLLRSDQ